MRTPFRGVVLVVILAVGSLTAMAVPASATTKPAACSAKMSSASPQQYTTTTVQVTKVGSKAKVTTAAHYKTTTTSHTATASTKGAANLAYAIGGAAPDRKVTVNVTASAGSKKWACSTSFTPKQAACSVKMSVPNPKQYSTTVAEVSKVGSKAKVTTVAHYRTTSTPHTATAGTNGAVNIPYKISTATVGYKVTVNVTATSGSKKWLCSTSFIPKSR